MNERPSLWSLAAAAVAVAAGFAYMALGEASLTWVLPVMTAAFGAIAAVTLIRARRPASGGGLLENLAVWLPGRPAAVVALFAAVGTAAWFLR
jgi:hypothetical protein